MVNKEKKYKSPALAHWRQPKKDFNHAETKIRQRFEAKNKLYKNLKIRTKKIIWKSRHKKMRYKGALRQAQGTPSTNSPDSRGRQVNCHPIL